MPLDTFNPSDRSSDVRSVAAEFGVELPDDVATADSGVAALVAIADAPEPQLPGLDSKNLAEAVDRFGSAKAKHAAKVEAAAALLPAARQAVTDALLAAAPQLIDDTLVPAFFEAWSTVQRLDDSVGDLTSADLAGVSVERFENFNALGVAAHRLDQVLSARVRVATALGEPILAERGYGSLPVLAITICEPPPTPELVKVFPDVMQTFRSLSMVDPLTRWREVLRLERDGRLIGGLAKCYEPIQRVQAFETFTAARWKSNDSVYV